MPLQKFHRAACALSLLVSLCFAPLAMADEAQDVSKLIRASQYDQALQKADQFLSTHPRDAQMRFLKGLILTEQNKTTDAIGVFTRLTEDFPELPEPYNNLAVLYATQGQYDKARAALEMAIRTHPSYATAHENLGDVYAKLASQAYDKALQIDSSNTAAQTKLSLIRELISNTTPKHSGPVAAPVAAPVPVAATKPVPVAAPTMVAAVTPKPVPAPAPVKAVEPPKPAPVPAPVPVPMPAPAPVVVATPAPTPAKAEVAATDPEIAGAVESWAKAWSSKNVDGYLASYAKEFQPPKGLSRSQWEEERRSRIVGKGHISVRVESLQVSSDGSTATAKFRQIYSSDKLDASSRKTLVLVKSSGRWLIQQERTGS